MYLQVEPKLEPDELEAPSPIHLNVSTIRLFSYEENIMFVGKFRGASVFLAKHDDGSIFVMDAATYEPIMRFEEVSADQSLPAGYTTLKSASPEEAQAETPEPEHDVSEQDGPADPEDGAGEQETSE